MGVRTLTKAPKMTAKKYSCVAEDARPQRRNATIPLPIPLRNITHGYGYRSLKCPRMSWPPTAEELKIEVTTMAVKGVVSAVVNVVMYRDTGK